MLRTYQEQEEPAQERPMVPTALDDTRCGHRGLRLTHELARVTPPCCTLQVECRGQPSKATLFDTPATTE